MGILFILTYLIIGFSTMVQFNSSGFPDIPAGKAFYVTWIEATGPVALTLLKVPYNAETVPTILGDAGQVIENNTVIRIACMFFFCVRANFGAPRIQYESGKLIN